MKKIGLMGCGTVAGYGHLPALRDSKVWELHAIFEPDPGRRMAAQEKFRVPHAFDDVDAFFASGIDAVAITSPAPCHLENVRDAVRHNTPILCEKPLAMTEAEGEEMIALTREAKLALFTGFTYRFGSEALKIKALLGQGVIGDLRTLRLVYIWNCHGRYELDAGGNRIEQRRREGRMLEGGPMVDCGVHYVDLARWWTQSEVVRFEGLGSWVQHYRAPDHVWVHMDHANGAHTMAELSYTYCHTAKEPVHKYLYDLIGTEGVIRYDGLTGELEVRSSEGTQSCGVERGKNFSAMYDAFARALDSGMCGNLATAEDGLIATRIARKATDDIIVTRLKPAR